MEQEPINSGEEKHHSSKTASGPIGIFDSGIGGLTVARAIADILPCEQLIYYGDTAHMPYGNKSVSLVSGYAVRIAGFLLDQMHCKAVVIACNTASAAAYTLLRDKYQGHAPVINVIDPMVEAVIADESVKKVGIIGTLTTITSGVYQEKFSRRKPQLKYAAVATPLLASLIEEGFYLPHQIGPVLNQYLSHPSLTGMDGLILACTHYPIIKEQIDDFFGHRVKIFDSGQVAAHKLKQILERENLLASNKQKEDEFYVSDLTDSFIQNTKLFFSRQVNLKLKTI
jgi:glutamate racemase